MKKPILFTLDSGTSIELKVTPIGEIDQYNGSNRYILIERLDDVLTVAQAKQFVAYTYYHQDFDNPGGSFCNSCSCVHQQNSDTTIIATIYQRFDI